MFLEDTSLHDLASIPFARELRPLGGGWHPIDIDRLSRCLDLAAQTAEKTFAEAANRLSRQWRFEVAKGPMTTTIGAISQISDILVISEPISAAERATQQFSWLAQAAFRSAAAVLVVPSRIARVRGQSLPWQPYRTIRASLWRQISQWPPKKSWLSSTRVRMQ